MKPFSIFSGTSHPLFAREVASYLNTTLGNVAFTPFPDKELSLRILDNVYGKEVFVIQSIAYEPNNYLMELMIFIDALKRSSAKGITAIIPYLGYTRQDRRDRGGMPITARLVANLLTTAGASRVVTMDLHTGQSQGFFDIPVDHLFARRPLCAALAKYNFHNPVVLAPDLGGAKRARYYAKQLGADFALIDKRRFEPLSMIDNINEEEVLIDDAWSIGQTLKSAVIGNVEDRDVILVDDMCVTGLTLISAAEALQRGGAKRIFACFTHGLFVDNAREKLNNSPIEKIFTTNTIPVSTVPASVYTPLAQGLMSNKFEEVSVVPIFGEAIKSVLLAE